MKVKSVSKNRFSALKSVQINTSRSVFLPKQELSLGKFFDSNSLILWKVKFAFTLAVDLIHATMKSIHLPPSQKPQRNVNKLSEINALDRVCVCLGQFAVEFNF